MATFKKLQDKFATKEQAKRQEVLVWDKEFWKACNWFYKKGKKEVSFQEEVSYSATGLVLGITWEGVEGMSPTCGLKELCLGCGSIKEVLDRAKVTLASATGLTGTGDFQQQLGAILVITKETTIMVNGKPFVNTEVSREFIGELSAEQLELLDEEMGW